jgi:hypothetical protein
MKPLVSKAPQAYQKVLRRSVVVPNASGPDIDVKQLKGFPHYGK